MLVRGISSLTRASSSKPSLSASAVILLTSALLITTTSSSQYSAGGFIAEVQSISSATTNHQQLPATPPVQLHDLHHLAEGGSLDGSPPAVNSDDLPAHSHTSRLIPDSVPQASRSPSTRTSTNHNLHLPPLITTPHSHHHHSGPPKLHLNESAILLTHQPSPLSFLSHDRHLKISNPLTGDLVPDQHHTPTYPSWIIVHAIGMILAWFVFLPLAIATSNHKSYWPSVICRAGFLSFLMLGIISGCVYRSLTPELYVGEKHSALGYIISLIGIGLSIFDLLPIWRILKSCSMRKSPSVNYLPVPDGDENRSQNSESPMFAWAAAYFHVSFLENGETNHLRAPFLSKILLCSKAVLDRAMVVAASAAVISGLVVYTGACRAEYINGCLAHFIKGGIFFWYGILSWTRYLGGYPEHGWPWGQSSEARIGSLSAEMIESIVVFIYGSTNVWMERFGTAPGEPYTVKQVQHVSIAMMFAFGGLAGIMLETPKLRRLLFRSDTGRTSNPFPTLCIAITGLAMSLHHQEYQFQVVIHTLWGGLLGLFGILRWTTYALGEGEGGPPITEALGSLCLISGGTVFMESVEQITFTAIRHKFDDVMAFLNVTIAFVCLVMLWIMILMVIKRSNS
ncbi:hypothetical protein PPACK8108_LOCUS6375 [Phakopsora pachyrhizi]|uniref:Protein YTP1-like C-terminal domain-containing protein n=1 Tax=Phakopsora pachyrhizi TaxID=170000 RepID=A0AAV0AUC4_PHAPC|nr:hypothetical protein PPACK8108_LOCUS6375 [Phakopsora pachyrhizi]